MAQLGEDTGVPNLVPKLEQVTWKAQNSADGELICGVAEECIIFPSSTTSIVVTDVPQPQTNEVVQYTFPDQDFLDIQVTEEEVISETWDNGQQPDDDRYNRYIMSTNLILVCN